MSNEKTKNTESEDKVRRVALALMPISAFLLLTGHSNDESSKYDSTKISQVKAGSIMKDSMNTYLIDPNQQEAYDRVKQSIENPPEQPTDYVEPDAVSGSW